MVDRVGFEELFFVRNTNGIANGPKTAPIIAQNLVFAPLLLAICQRRNAHDMHIIEIIIIPVMMQFLLCLAYNLQTTDTLREIQISIFLKDMQTLFGYQNRGLLAIVHFQANWGIEMIFLKLNLVRLIFYQKK